MVALTGGQSAEQVEAVKAGPHFTCIACRHVWPDRFRDHEANKTWPELGCCPQCFELLGLPDPWIVRRRQK